LVHFRKGSGISVFSVFDGEFEGPHNSKVGGLEKRAAALLPGNAGGSGEQSPDQLSDVSISSVQYLFQFGQLCFRSLYEANLDVCEYELVPAAMYISVSRWHVHRL
jgi:hypothetical protein